MCTAAHYPRSVGQRGATLLLIMLVMLSLGVVLGLGNASHVFEGETHPDLSVNSRLRDARLALLQWAGQRLTLTTPTLTPPGFLPYPDRNGDGNYDGTSDCLSGTGLAQNSWRAGRLPFLGERLPCESRNRGRAEASASAAATASRAMMSLDIREHDGEMLWYAASVNVLDDDRIGTYPDISVASLLQRNSGWLTVCTQDGRLLSTDVAFVVIAPGVALPGQRRRAKAPGRQQFLDAYPLAGAAPCNGVLESNADNNTIFIANSGIGHVTPFNDRLTFVRRNEYVSHLALAQARQLAGLLQLQPFPYAARSGSGDGQCVPGLLDGRLPLRNGPSCSAMQQIPLYLADGHNAQYTQVHYTRSPDGERVTLAFEHCAMRFTVSHGGFSYAPGRC